MNKYFMHRIKHNATTDAWDKGIEVKDTPEGGGVKWRVEA